MTAGLRFSPVPQGLTALENRPIHDVHTKAAATTLVVVMIAATHAILVLMVATVTATLRPEEVSSRDSNVVVMEEVEIDLVMASIEEVMLPPVEVLVIIEIDSSQAIVATLGVQNEDPNSLDVNNRVLSRWQFILDRLIRFMKTTSRSPSILWTTILLMNWYLLLIQALTTNHS
jgi:hypothetical protein